MGKKEKKKEEKTSQLLAVQGALLPREETEEKSRAIPLRIWGPPSLVKRPIIFKGRGRVEKTSHFLSPQSFPTRRGGKRGRGTPTHLVLVELGSLTPLGKGKRGTTNKALQWGPNLYH